MSGIVNKIKEAVSGDTTTHNTSTLGTHDNRGTVGGTTGHGFGTNTGATTTTAGPHSSDLANKLDPRVDSTAAAGHHHHDHHHHHGTGGGLTGTSGATGARQGEYGPHNSRLANTLDPRVDSDRDGSRTLNAGVGSGPAPNTAGPHKSDLANKLDPRVDSDLDGSNTLGGTGGNRRFQEGERDPTDAAHVPPSVLRQHVGDPVIDHGDHSHDRERRNTSISDQDAFRGI